MSATLAENTKERLIECGLKIMSEKSYNGSGLSEILKAADVPKGSFYHYFKSKEDFAIAIVEENASQHISKMKEVLSDRSRSPMQRIYDYHSLLRDYFRENGGKRECLIAKLALEVSQLSEPIRAAIKSAYRQFAAILEQAIIEAQNNGEIDTAFNPESLANVLINDWEGATMRMQIEGDTKPLDQFFEVIMDHGLKLGAQR